MVRHTQTIRRQIAKELFDYVWPFCVVDAWSVNAQFSCSCYDFLHIQTFV